MVISSRYQGLVFGLSGAAPGLGLTAGAYTRNKLSGALAHAGLGDWVLPIEIAAGGLLGAAVSELWSRRDEIGLHLAR